MVRRIEPETESLNRDERLGEAIETYLALAEGGQAPAPAVFAAGYPELGDDLIEALEGLALVQGLVGESERPGHRLESGRRIAGYRIVRELGRGGMGIVYEAVHVGLDRPVALKVLGAQAAPDSSGRRRFLNEARTAAGLHHTHIVPVFDVGQVGGLCYYAMQRIEGCGLDRVLKQLRRERPTGAGSTTGSPQSGPARTPSGPRTGTATPAPAPTRVTDSTRTWNHASGLGLPGAPAVPPGDDEDEPRFDPPRGSAYYRWVAAVGRQAAEALGHAHQRGVIHRDVKPSNLLVDARGTVWVADFGLARRLADPGLTQLDSLLGTPRYMSPEQARTGPIDGRTDVYSLGATLYELLTLRPPFEGQTAAELVEQIGQRDPVALRKRDPRIPRDLETIVLKCLAKRPADRYATALELAEDLGRYLDHEPVKARRIGPIGRSWRFAQRHPALTAVSATAATVVLTIGTVAYVRVVQERDAAERANEATQQALVRVKSANEAAQVAIREGLWREASVVRLSNVPNRRALGLGRIKEAAALSAGASPEFLTRLREEAVAFLALRDVQARPGLPAGQTEALAFGPQGRSLAALSDDGQKLTFWDLEKAALIATQPLGQPAEPAPGLGPGGPDRGGNRRWTPPPLTAAVGPYLAVVVPGDRELRLFDALNGAFHKKLSLGGHPIFALYAAAGTSRLVTVDWVAGRDADDRGEPGPVPGSRPGPGPRWPGRFRVSLRDLDQPDRAIAILAPATDDDAAAVAGATPGGGPGARLIPHVALAPDGQTVAVASPRQSKVTLWSTEDGRPLGTLETQAEITTLALGPRNQLAVASYGTIRLWDTSERVTQANLASHQSYTRLLRFSPDGSLLAVAGLGTDIELWDPVTAGLVAALPTEGRVDDFAFSPDGRMLFAAGQAEEVAAWDVVAPVGQTRLTGFNPPVGSLAFHDDLLAMLAFNGELRFWQPGRCVRSGQPARPGPAAEPATAAARAGDAGPGRPPGMLATFAFDDRGRLIGLNPLALKIWDDPTRTGPAGEISLPEVPGPPIRMHPLARSRDGKTLAFSLRRDVFRWRSDAPDRVELLDLPSPEPRSRRQRREAERGQLPSWRVVALSPDGDRIYLLNAAGENTELLAWTVGSTEPPTLLWTGRRDVSAHALSADGSTLALGGDDGDVLLIDTARGREVAWLHAPEGRGEADGKVSALAFAPDDRELAVGGQNGTLRLWSLGARPAPIVSLPRHHGWVTALSYSGKGDHLASASADRTVDVWEVARIRSELAALGLAW